jgi:hypothetical protein
MPPSGMASGLEAPPTPRREILARLFGSLIVAIGAIATM